ncbi:group II intron maturase-specific domain-containing protein [Kitasatospora sp. NPDC057223]|uniref:group II intron maturase-specific domain-containing protein n=1 Tax=Kitasatospora sp. NPDC057223 TaxID=3346055 RepID=UPI00362986A2
MRRHGKLFPPFDPAISREALTGIGQEMRSWSLHRRCGFSLSELARRINPVVAGWLKYYGRFRPWELHSFLMRINAHLVRMIRTKHRRLAGKRKALAKLREIAKWYPRREPY